MPDGGLGVRRFIQYGKGHGTPQFGAHIPVDTAEFTVAFERATVELKRDKLMIYTETEAKELEASYKILGLPTDDGYVNEMIDFIECIKNDTESKINPPEASKLTVDIAYAEKQSAIEGREVEII